MVCPIPRVSPAIHLYGFSGLLCLCLWAPEALCFQVVRPSFRTTLSVFSCDTATLWMFQSVRLSLTPFSLYFHHRIIMEFSGVITIGRSDVHAKGQGQRSKVKFTEVKNLFNRFWAVTPVGTHTWRWNHAQSLIWHRRGAFVFLKGYLSDFKVTRDNFFFCFRFRAFPREHMEGIAGNLECRCIPATFRID